MAEGMKLLVLTIVLARAVYTDVKKGVIENGLILFGMATGLCFTFFGGNLAAVWLSVKTAAIILVSLFFLFLIKGLGAGDIKLFTVLAVYLQKDVVLVMILSFFLGAVIAILKMLARFLKKEKWYIKGEQLNFSVPIAIGTMITLLWR